MDRLLVTFLRQRMTGRVDFDLGEIFDAAEQHFRTKLDARAFFNALHVVLREPRRETRSWLRHSTTAAVSGRQLPRSVLLESYMPGYVDRGKATAIAASIAGPENVHDRMRDIDEMADTSAQGESSLSVS